MRGTTTVSPPDAIMPDRPREDPRETCVTAAGSCGGGEEKHTPFQLLHHRRTGLTTEEEGGETGSQTGFCEACLYHREEGHLQHLGGLIGSNDTHSLYPIPAVDREVLDCWCS